MTPDLLIPLSWLPGPLPVGAPVWASQHVPRAEDPDFYEPLYGSGVYAGPTLGEGPPVALSLPPMQPIQEVAPDHVTPETCLDLTPPPTDAAGYPLRVDGLDVAAAMLARALGRRCVAAWLDLPPSSDAPAGYRVRLRCAAADAKLVPAVYLDTLAGPLPQVDPADPLAVRRLMVELFRRRVWEVAP